MKKLHLNLCLLFIVSIIISSCSISNKFSQTSGFRSKSKNIDLVKYNNSPKNASIIKDENMVLEDSVVSISFEENRSTDNSEFTQSENSNFTQKDDLPALGFSELDSKNNNPKDSNEICDLIILQNGDEIFAKILEITPETIKYKKCGNLDGPDYIENKSNIFMIKFSNGTKEVYKQIPLEKEITEENENKKVPASVVIGFIASIIGLFIFGVPFGIIALILGNVGISKINNNGKNFKGLGLGVAAIIIGLADIILTLIVLSKMY